MHDEIKLDEKCSHNSSHGHVNFIAKSCLNVLKDNSHGSCQCSGGRTPNVVVGVSTCKLHVVECVGRKYTYS